MSHSSTTHLHYQSLKSDCHEVATLFALQPNSNSQTPLLANIENVVDLLLAAAFQIQQQFFSYDVLALV